MTSRTDIGRGLLRRLLRRGDETDLTEHLAELLRVPDLGRAFLRLVEIEPRAQPFASDLDIEVDTQVIDPETRARPDLVVSTPETTVWVEAKLDAGLTVNQPLGYLKALARCDAPEKHLVFIIKSRRWAELSVEIRTRVGIAEDYARRFLHQEIPVTVTTWREVRDSFEAVPIPDPIAAYLLAEFIDHIDHHIERKVIPLTPELIPVLHDPRFLNAFAGLEDVLTDLMEHLEADGHEVRQQEKGELRQHGFYVAPRGDEDRHLDMWVGLVARAGVAFERGPLWLWLYGEGWDEDAEARLKAAGFDLVADEKKLPEWAECCLVPLALSGATSGEQVQRLVEQVQRMWRCGVQTVAEVPIGSLLPEDKKDVLAAARTIIEEMIRTSTEPVVDLEGFGDRLEAEHPALTTRLKVHFNNPRYTWFTFAVRHARRVVDATGSHKWSPVDKRWHLVR